MNKVEAAAELARLAKEAGKPELAKIALEFWVERANQLAPRAANPAHGMRLNLSQFHLPEDQSSDSTDIDVLNSARTWEHYELESSNVTVHEAGGVDTVNLLPETLGSSRTAKRRFRRQRVRQKLRLLEQFPQLTPLELQYHQRLQLLEE